MTNLLRQAKNQTRADLGTAEAVTDSSAGAGKHQTLTPLACRGEGDARRYQGDDLIGATGQ
jgi:hypothetical protein